MKIWLETYNTFHPDDWARNSVSMAHTLTSIVPHLIHIEKKSLVHPTWQNIEYLYKKNYNLSENYSIHLFLMSLYFIPDNMQELDGFNCTVVSAMRMILYGSPKLRRTSQWVIVWTKNGPKKHFLL